MTALDLCPMCLVNSPTHLAMLPTTLLRLVRLQFMTCLCGMTVGRSRLAGGLHGRITRRGLWQSRERRVDCMSMSQPLQTGPRSTRVLTSERLYQTPRHSFTMTYTRHPALIAGAVSGTCITVSRRACALVASAQVTLTPRTHIATLPTNCTH